jgi:hypothetical protein
VGHKFSLILSREITDEESVALKETDAVCAGAVFATDTLPTNAEVTVTKMDFDDSVSPSLAEAIEAALQAVQKVSDLTVPGLTVPAVPKQAPAEPGVVEGTVVEDTVLEGTVVEDKPSAKKATTRKPAAKKTTTSSRKRTAATSAESDETTGDAGTTVPQDEEVLQTT